MKEQAMSWESQLTASQKAELLKLWNSEFPRQIAHQHLESLEHYLSKLNNIQHLLIEENDRLLAWFACFEREGEVWFIIIVSRQAQGLGLGRSLMQEAMHHYNSLNGWIVNHEEYTRQDNKQYPSPARFYQKLGFRVLPDITLEKGGIVSTKIVWESEEG
jgi:GNAT superfamily N-acetyltransferase